MLIVNGAMWRKNIEKSSWRIADSLKCWAELIELDTILPVWMNRWDTDECNITASVSYCAYEPWFLILLIQLRHRFVCMSMWNAPIGLYVYAPINLYVYVKCTNWSVCLCEMHGLICMSMWNSPSGLYSMSVKCTDWSEMHRLVCMSMWNAWWEAVCMNEMRDLIYAPDV